MMINSNKLYNEVNQLTSKFSFYYKLDEDERQTLLSDVTLKIYNKMVEGKVPTEYSKYVGYMTISIKNHIYAVLNRKRTIRAKIMDHSTEDVTYTHPSTSIELDNTKQLLRIAVKKLPPMDRAIIRWKLRGWLYSEIANALQIPRPTLMYEYERVTERLQLLFLHERQRTSSLDSLQVSHQ